MARVAIRQPTVARKCAVHARGKSRLQRPANQAFIDRRDQRGGRVRRADLGGKDSLNHRGQQRRRWSLSGHVAESESKRSAGQIEVVIKVSTDGHGIERDATSKWLPDRQA